MRSKKKRQLEEIEKVFQRRDGFDLVEIQAAALMEQTMFNYDY
jgi:hypothetical protein